MTPIDVYSEPVAKVIKELITTCGGNPAAFDSELVMQLIQNSLRLLSEKHDTGQLKLITRAMKEMRYAYRVFNNYGNTRKVSVFGSARTPEDHPDYLAAKDFSFRMVESGWICITGAANGIMKAGLEGHHEEPGFGLSIKLPFEVPINPLIEGDPKHITFRYFFTRKLMFLSHSNAVAAFPGGFGTMDELYEVLTLMQTGKANIMPVVLLEGKGGQFWENWQRFLIHQFLEKGWIGEEDQYLYYIASSPQDGVDHIHQFYRKFHSYRYVKDDLVIRLKAPIDAQYLETLNKKYVNLIQSGSIRISSPLPEETDNLNLFRLVFHHTRLNFGFLRAMIDDINRSP